MRPFASASALLLALLLTALAPTAHAQSVIYVDRDASGANDGSSWANAYTNLQTAIDNATGTDQIWIAEGTYKPTFDRGGTVQFSYLAYRNRSFVIPDSKDGLKLYGGFDGTETALSQRNPAAHEVILSGDINSNTGGSINDVSFEPDTDSDADSDTRPFTDHLRGSYLNGDRKRGFGGNVNHVVFLGSGLSRSTVMDGVTITGGFAVAQFATQNGFVGGEQRNFGGGLFCDGCSATIRGVTFRGNYAHVRGGAVYVTGGGSPRILNSVFWGNNAGGQPPTLSDPLGDQEFAFYFVSGPGDTNGSFLTKSISDGEGAAVYNDDGSPDLHFLTFFQHPDSGDASTLENVSISGDDALNADLELLGAVRAPVSDLDLDPDSPTFLQITAENSSLVDQSSASRLPADTEDLDGDGDTSEPLPVDVRGAERIQGAAPDPGAYESPFSTAPNPRAAAVPVGERLPIVGNGVDAATAVRINGTPATNLTGTGDGNERITVTVAEGTTSGAVEIDTPGGTITTEESVTIVDPSYGPGQALDATGSVELANEAAFDFSTPQSGSSGFTISLWTKGSFSVDKVDTFSGWRFFGAAGGQATFQVTVSGQEVSGQTQFFNPVVTISLPDDGQWHHVAAVYRFDDANEGTHTAEIYVDGEKQEETRTGDEFDLVDSRVVTNDVPVTLDAGGALDQVRVYDRPLAESDLLTDNSNSAAAELDVRRRIHRTADLSDGQYSGLIAEYRFDSGDPDTAFDFAGRNSGTYQSGAGTVLSTAPVGQDAGANPIGPDGASLRAASNTEFTGLYRYGNPDPGIRTSSDPGEVFSSALPDGLSERSTLTWGGYVEVTELGSISASRLPAFIDATIEYGSIASVSEPVGLLHREGPGSPWRVADGFTKDPSAETFSLAPNAVLPMGELAVASFPFSDLALTLTPETQALAPGETATFTATLTNDGPDDVPGVTVDFDATALSGLSASGGTFSGGTWDVGTLAGGASASLTLTATVESGADLPALRGTLGLNDINNGNNAAQAVVPASPAYGPGQALAFDGTDDSVNLGPDIRLDSRSFTISFWAKRASTGSAQTIISQGGSSSEALHVGFRSDDRFTARVGGSAVTTDDAVTDTEWHHWAVVFETTDVTQTAARFSIYRDGVQVKRGRLIEVYRGRDDFLIGRLAYANNQYFEGALDQVRIWETELSGSDIRARMHQRLAPGDAKAEFLLASYRFDEGSGTVAHSAGQGPLATLSGDPQWVPFSAARLGEESVVATSSSNASIGPAGAQLSATGASGDVQLYRYGDADSPLRTESDDGEDLSGLPTGIPERSHQTWGISVPGGTSPSATLTLDYSSAIGTATTPAPPVRLIRRDAPGQPWSLASAWTKDQAAQTFTSTGTVQTGEYALVTLPYADLAVSIDPPQPTPAGEDATFTVTLTNTGPDASVAASVDLSGSAELGTLTAASVPTGSFDGTTWTAGALASGASATLDVTAPFSGPAPGTLTATRRDAESVDSQADNDTGTAMVITPPYGPETALTFASGDWLRADPVSGVVSEASALTMETWVRLDEAGSNFDSFIAFHTGTGGNLNWLGYDHSEGKFLYYDDEIGNAFADISSPTGTWHHVAATIDASGSGVLYVNGTEEATFTTSVRPQSDGRLAIGQEWDGNTPSDFLDGTLDQVRIWSAALTEAEIRARMHQTLAPGDAAFGDLIASYRFDVGTGTTAYDLAGSNPATFQGDPQWTAFSGATIGQEQAVATAGTDASIGPSGATLTASGVSSGDVVQLYRYGQPDGPLRTASDPGDTFAGSASERSNLTWGIAVPEGTTPEGEFTLDYSGVSTLPSGDVTLVRRDRPGDDWTVASGWAHNKGGQQFRFFSGPVPLGEYAIADAPPPEITTNTGATVSQGEIVTLTPAMLETTDGNDGPGDLEYTVTSGPTNGQLLLFGEPLGSGQPFPQQLINNGQVAYVSDGTAGADTFDFEVTDGAVTLTGTFTITVETNAAYAASGGLQSLGEGGGTPQPVGDTGLLLDLQTVPGFSSGFVHVVRYDEAPANAESIDLPNLGTSRYVITTLGGLQVAAGTVFQIDTDALPHPDPSSVTIYQRPDEGTGTFTALATSYDPEQGVVETTVDGFSEYATAATDAFTVQVVGREGTGNDTGFRMLAVPNAFDRASLEDDLDFNVSTGALLQTFPGGGADGSDWVEVTESTTTIERGRASSSTSLMTASTRSARAASRWTCPTAGWTSRRTSRRLRWT